MHLGFESKTLATKLAVPKELGEVMGYIPRKWTPIQGIPENNAEDHIMEERIPGNEESDRAVNDDQEQLRGKLTQNKRKRERNEAK